MVSRNSNWVVSAESPLAVRSPSSLNMLPEIRGRLNFSSLSSPAIQPKRFSLVDRINHTPRVNSSPLNRLGDYHMSKQNPDVLDRLHSPNSSPVKEHLLHKKQLTSTGVNGAPPSSTIVLPSRNGRTPLQSSLLRQVFHNNHGSNSTGSLVHLATRRQNRISATAIPRSPVMVKLSGLETTSTNSDSIGTAASNQGTTLPSDPCDRNVVLSALRNKRKRWATSAPDDDITPSPLSPGVPLAKRSRHDTHTTATSSQSPQAHNSDRKRSRTLPTYPTPAFKRSKVIATDNIPDLTKCTNKITVPVIECEEDSESTSSGIGSQGESVCGDVGWPSESVANTRSDVIGRRSITPPTPVDETEMSRKREESLSLLKAVFPAKSDNQNSMRRKLPIFCATGAKPHMPTPLTVTHSATQEDLKKDRESTAAKLKQFLTAEDDEEPPPPQTKPTISSTSVVATTTASQLVNSNPLTGIKLGQLPSTATTTRAVTTTTVSTSVPLVSTLTVPPSITPPSSQPTSNPHSAKSVTFAPLPTSKSQPESTSIPSSTSSGSASQAGQLSTLNFSLHANTVQSQDSNKLNGFQFSIPSTGSSTLSLPITPSTATTTAGINLQLPPAAAVSTSTATTGLSLTAGSRPQTTGSSTFSLSGNSGLSSSNTQGGGMFGFPALPSSTSQLLGGVSGGIFAAPASQSTVHSHSQAIPPSTTSSTAGTGLVFTTASSQQPLMSGGVFTGLSQQSHSSSLPQLSTNLSAGCLTFNTSANPQQPGFLSQPLTTQAGTANSVTGGSLFQKTTSTSAPSTSGFSFSLSNVLGNSTAPNNTMDQAQQQQLSLPTGGLVFRGSQPNTTSSSGGLMFGQNTATQSNTGGLMFGQSNSTQSSLMFSGSQSNVTPSSAAGSGGLMFGPTNPSQPFKGGLMFGGLQTSTTQSSTGGLMFGGSQTNTTQSSTGGLMFGGSQTNTTQSSTGGLMFGGSQTSTTQSSTGGLMFGGSQTNTTQSSTGGLMFGGGMQSNATPSSNSGLMFGGSQSNSTPSFVFNAQPPQQKPGNTVSFNPSQNNNSGFNFSAGVRTALVANQNPSSSSLFNSGSNNASTSQSSVLTGFNFTASSTNQSLFSGNSQPSAPNAFNFSAQQNQGSSGGGVFGSSQQNSNTASRNVFSFSGSGQPQTSTSSGFNFSASAAGIGMGTNQSGGFNFESGTPNRGGMGMSLGGNQSKSGTSNPSFNFGGSQTPQSQFQFQTPQQQNTPTGANFPSTPNNTNMFATSSTGRPMARAIRRRRK